MKRSGYTLIELMIVVTLIAIILMVALPNFCRMRLSTRKTICVNNLRQIEGAVDRWVFENDVSEDTIVSDVTKEEIYSYIRGGELVCPSSGGTYTITAIGTYPQVTCNIDGHTLVRE